MTRGIVLLLAALLVPTVAGVAIRSSGAATGARSQAGSLALSAVLRFSGSPAACPPQAGGTNECYRVDGQGVVPGLGRVSESFVVPLVSNAAGCPATSSFQALGFLARLTVAGKGAIHLAVADSAECLGVGGVQRLSRPFAVTGGTGIYATATGSGILSRHLVASQGTDTWKGRLVVPGVQFNLTAPTIRGATSKTVRAPKGAKRARVTYAVTAEDDRNGRVPVSCTPRSGIRFKVGRTKVTCSATDGDGNTQTATFTVRVLTSVR
jgi:HYR domain